MNEVPSYPPTRVVIDVPLDSEPRVIEEGGLTPYLLNAVLVRCAQQYETVWELEPVEDD